MTTEITFTEDPQAETPPPPTPVETKNGKAKKEKEKEQLDEDESKSRASPVLRQLRLSEDLSLKEIVDQFGTDGSFAIRVVRKWPETVIDASGKRVQTSGFLAKVDKAIDEEWLQEHYGGGTYELTFRKKDAKGKYEKDGSYSRTFTIAGDPSLAELPRVPGMTPASPSAPAAAPEASPTIVTKTLDFMERQIEKAESRTGGRSADDPMYEIMREQLRESREQNARLAAKLESLSERLSQPPAASAEDKLKDRLLDKMIDQDSARITAVRTQFESEIRQLKEAAIQNEARLQDRFDRDRSEMRSQHDREITLLRTTHETALASARSSFEVQLEAARQSFSTSKEILTKELNRAERELGDLRDELKELRAKKDKSLVEQVTEIEKIKEALGVDGDGDKSTADKIVEAVTNPEAIAAVSSMFGKGQVPGQPQPQQSPPEPPPRPRPRVVRDRTSGQKFIVSADGKSMRPAVPPPVPGQPQLPEIPPEVVAQVVGYLERSYTGGQDPEIVAQSGKASVPEPILMLIRDVGGVDAFLTKVAKLPSSSPLSSTQAGRNWVKKVGKALVGE